MALKLTANEYTTISTMAELHSGGNISEWVRESALNYKPEGTRFLVRNRSHQKQFDDIVHFFISLKPSRIILFGSQARGDSDQVSDYDFLLIFKDEKPTYSDLLRSDKLKVRRKLPCDVLLATEEEFNKLCTSKFHVYGRANKEGVTIYESK